ncbi:HAMP domain-containing protein [Calditerricola yamamurae]
MRRSVAETASLGKAMNKDIDSLVGAMEKRFRTVSDRGLDYARTTVVVLTVGLILSVVLGLSLAVLFTRYLTRALGHITEVAQRVAQGELRIEPLPIRSRDELGCLAQAINEMVDQLRGMIHNVQDAARQLAASAEALSAGAEQTSQAAQEIAQSVQAVAGGAEAQVRAMEENVGSRLAAAPVGLGIGPCVRVPRHTAWDFSCSLRGNNKQAGGCATFMMRKGTNTFSYAPPIALAFTLLLFPLTLSFRQIILSLFFRRGRDCGPRTPGHPPQF